MNNRLPPLDFLRGFESAARHLSFTRAAEELFITQSAVSRQIKALEDHLGVPLFKRMNRSLQLTEDGKAMYRLASDVIQRVHETTARIKASRGNRVLTLSTTLSFVSLWLVPRLPRWRALHPDIDVRIAANDAMVDLDRDDIDLAVRFCTPQAAPEGAVRMDEEVVFPVCSPALLRDKRRPLKRAEDLKHQVLLHFEGAAARWPWLDWSQWLAAERLQDLQPAGSLRFSHYDHLIRAAIDGEGVALGRTPLLRSQLKSGELVAPFDKRTTSGRQYFVVTSRASRTRPEVQALVKWLLDEANSKS
jgi:LysR family glycine cleavage system transcriptional activator